MFRSKSKMNKKSTKKLKFGTLSIVVTTIVILFSFVAIAKTVDELKEVYLTREEFNNWVKSESPVLASLEVAMQESIQKELMYQMWKRKVPDAAMATISSEEMQSMQRRFDDEMKTFVSYNIIYNAMGGDVSPSQVVKYYNKAITLDTPTKTGYNFLGWYKESGYTNLYDGSSDLTSTNGANVNIYAKWEGVKYNITYNLNLVPADPPTSSPLEKQYGVNLTINQPLNIPSGYTFKGWYSDSSFENEYTGNTDLSTTQGDSKSIYAKWEATLSFDVNGIGTAPSSMSVLLDSSVTLPVLSDTDEYEFGGWKDEDGTIVGNSYLVEEPTVLTANWIPKT